MTHYNKIETTEEKVFRHLSRRLDAEEVYNLALKEGEFQYLGYSYDAKFICINLTFLDKHYWSYDEFVVEMAAVARARFEKTYTNAAPFYQMSQTQLNGTIYGSYHSQGQAQAALSSLGSSGLANYNSISNLSGPVAQNLLNQISQGSVTSITNEQRDSLYQKLKNMFR